MAPHQIEINDRYQAEVPSVAGGINHLATARTNGTLTKHIDNEMNKDG